MREVQPCWAFHWMTRSPSQVSFLIDKLNETRHKPKVHQTRKDNENTNKVTLCIYVCICTYIYISYMISYIVYTMMYIFNSLLI